MASDLADMVAKSKRLEDIRTQIEELTQEGERLLAEMFERWPELNAAGKPARRNRRAIKAEMRKRDAAARAAGRGFFRA